MQALQPLAVVIRIDSGIKGIHESSGEHKAVYYADEILVLKDNLGQSV